jgi:putative lipoprotein
MIAPRTLLFCLLPVFAGCQSYPWTSEAPARPTERLQGLITQEDGGLRFNACQGKRNLELIDSNQSGLLEDMRALTGGAATPVFADVRGRLASQGNERGQLQLSRLYRLQMEGPACGDSLFSQLILRASGHEPGWSVEITQRGMLLKRPDHSPLALPFLEEQLPGGQTSFSSEANAQQLDLWVAPQRCVDRSTGTVSHLTAELRLDGQTLRGCAYYGGARQD